MLNVTYSSHLPDQQSVRKSVASFELSRNNGLSCSDCRNRRPYLTTTTSPNNDIDGDSHAGTKTDKANAEEAQHAEVEEEVAEEEIDQAPIGGSKSSLNDLGDEEEAASTDVMDNERITVEDPVVGRLMTTAVSSASETKSMEVGNEREHSSVSLEAAKATRPDDIPDITSLFTDAPVVHTSRKETAFDGLLTHEVRSSSRANPHAKLEHRESPDGSLEYESNSTEAPDSGIEDSHTIGPYDSVQEDYVNDQAAEEAVASSGTVSPVLPGKPTDNNKKEHQQQQQQQQDEDSSTFLPEAEPDYRYNMKWRSMGKVLEPPSN